MGQDQIRQTTLHIGVLASHHGTTLQAILDACEAGTLRAQVVTVISNNSQSGAAQRAQRHAVPFAHLSGHTHPEPEALDEAICDTLVQHDADIVVLAGYMKKLGPRTLKQFEGRILNTHPALLPKFGGQGMYGSRVHEAVLAAGESTTGVSIHVVDAGYDTGPVIAQCEVPVHADDTVESLAERVQRRERAFLVETLQTLSNAAPCGEQIPGGEQIRHGMQKIKMKPND
jgi:phosphoribosylglycinamide formyltransferase 1